MIQSSAKIEYHKKDSTWEVYRVTSTQDHIDRFMPDLALVDGVPDDVKSEFKSIGQLIACSYYHYQLYDEAVRKIILIFELALKIKYKEITLNDWGRKSLEKLIEDLYNRNLFNASKEFLSHVRITRNSFAHPKKYSFGGPALLHWIENITLIINELFEPNEIRTQRNQQVEKVNSSFKKMQDSAPLIYQDRQESFLQLHDIKCLLFDKKTDQYLLAVFPTFELKSYQDIDYHGDIPFILVILKNLKKVNGSQKLTGYDIAEKRNVFIMLNKDSPLNLIHQNWLLAFKKLKQHHMLQYLMAIELGEIYTRAKQHFLTKGKICSNILVRKN